MEQLTGRRRSEEELEKYKSDRINTKFRLKEQTVFRGSPELLSEMQRFERSYREGRPLITDEEWDRLVKETGYEESLDEIVSPNGRNWVRMRSPLPSLGKITSIPDLVKYHEGFPEGQKFVMQPKLDGLTFNAIYLESECGEFNLYSVTTRGDGINGLKLHPNALKGVELLGLPYSIPESDIPVLRTMGAVLENRIEIRGEAVIDKEKYFAENDIENRDQFVPRSIAAGIFNSMEASNFNYLGSVLAGSEADYVTPERCEEEWLRTNKETRKFISRYGLLNGRANKEAYDAVVAFTDVLNSESYPELFGKKDGRWVCVKDNHRGKLRKDHLYFVTFSASSEDGNVDNPALLSVLDGFIYVGTIPDFKGIFKITDSLEELIAGVDKFYGTKNGVRDFDLPRFKTSSRFPCDGVVIKPIGSNIRTQEMTPKEVRGQLVVPKYPKDQVAVKLETDPVRTRIVKLNYKTTGLGNTTVSAEVEPVVAEGGALIRSVNLHNPNWLALPENSWIKEGAECCLRLSMDIIPIISRCDE